MNVGGRHAAFGGDWNWGLNAYRTTADDLIVYNPLVGDFGAPDNIGKARIDGVEAQFGAAIAALRAQLYLNWLDPRNRSDGANKSNVLPRRARQTARLDLDYDWHAFSLGTTVFAAGQREDNVDNTVRLGGYTSVDLRADWRLLPAWTLQAKATNVFDKAYETARGYASLGTSWFFTVRYTPGA